MGKVNRMADQCKHCEYRGNIEECEKTDCTIHESWYVKTLKEREAAAIALLREYQGRAKTDNSQN